MVDDFLSVQQTPHATRSGPCQLPILYSDGSHFGVLFRVDLKLAREVIGHDASVEAWPIFGAALAAIYVWEYRSTTIGPYREVGLGIQARRKGTRPSLVRLLRDMGAQEDQGIWVVNLPVTSQPAFDAGVDLWGYPKYISEVETKFSANAAEARLASEIELSIGRLRGPTLRGQPVTTYTQRQGRLIRTVIEVDHRVTWGTGGSARLKVIGEGPLAETVRRLGLESATRLGAFHCPLFRARVPAGLDLGDATTPPA